MKYLLLYIAYLLIVVVIAVPPLNVFQLLLAGVLAVPSWFGVWWVGREWEKREIALTGLFGGE